MKFWDSSAIVPLLVKQPATPVALRLLREDPEVAVWWSTPVECSSALARLERENEASDAIAASFDRLDELTHGWIEVEPVDELRDIARRLMRVHPLRSGDSLQLAAAYLLAERRPASLEIITFDARLRTAALKEGFQVPAL